ncbi:hypothetical protein ACMWMF_15375 [Escherichia coli]
MTTITRELIAAYLNGEVKTLTNSEQKELARIFQNTAICVTL